MTEPRDVLEDFEPSLPERNQQDRDLRVKQIIEDTRRQLRGEGDVA